MTSYFATEQDIERLVAGFADRSLPIAQWTHQAHLATAIWYNRKYTPMEALCLLRSGIISYNIASGGANTPERGYHETLTVFWCFAIAAYVHEHPGQSLHQMVEEFLSSEWATREFPLKFYSKEKLFSLVARATWMEPDQAPAPWSAETIGRVSVGSTGATAA